MGVITRRRYALFQHQWTFTFNTISQLVDPLSCLFLHRMHLTIYLHSMIWKQFFFSMRSFRLLQKNVIWMMQSVVSTFGFCHTYACLWFFLFFFLFGLKMINAVRIVASHSTTRLFLTCSVKHFFLSWIVCCHSIFERLRTFCNFLHHNRGLNVSRREECFRRMCCKVFFLLHPIVHWIRWYGIFQFGIPNKKQRCADVFLLIERTAIAFGLYCYYCCAFNSICNNRPCP